MKRYYGEDMRCRHCTSANYVLRLVHEERGLFLLRSYLVVCEDINEYCCLSGWLIALVQLSFDLHYPFMRFLNMSAEKPYSAWLEHIFHVY